MNEWIDCSLSEIIELIGGGTPKTTVDEFWNGDIPWLSVVDFNNDDRWVNETEKAITDKGLNNSSTKLLNKGDLIISARGTVGELAQLSKPMAFNQSCYGICAKQEYTHNDYLYYLIKHSLNQFKRKSHGAVFDTITRETFNYIDICLPQSHVEQKAIASILSSLDSKIDLLSRQNQTLENIAQTLFKRWFFDFEFPDKDGNPYKSSGGKMVEGELGEIPEGWKVGKLEDITEILNGFAFKSNEYKDHGAQVIRTTNFCSLGYLELNDLVYLEPEAFGIYEKYQLQLFDFLLVMVGASIGKSVIVSSHALPSLQNQNMWNFRSKIKNGQFYLIYTMRRTVKANIGSASGSARDFFRKDYFYSLSCVIPSQSILGLFNDNIQTVYKKIDNNISEIQTLTKIRDTLLPKLMSGQIRVKGL